MRSAAVLAASVLVVALAGCAAPGQQALADAEQAVSDVLDQLEAGEGAAVAAALQLDIEEADAILLAAATERITDPVVGADTGTDTYATGDDPYGPRIVHATWTLAGEQIGIDFTVDGQGEDATVALPEGSSILTTVAVSDAGPIPVAGGELAGTNHLLPGVYDVQDPGPMLLVNGISTAAGDIVANPGQTYDLYLAADLQAAIDLATASEPDALEQAAETIATCQPEHTAPCVVDYEWAILDEFVHTWELDAPTLTAGPDMIAGDLATAVASGCWTATATGTGQATNAYDIDSSGGVTATVAIQISIDPAGTPTLTTTASC